MKSNKFKTNDIFTLILFIFRRITIKAFSIILFVIDLLIFFFF